MKVLVTGSRDWTDRALIYSRLKELNPSCVVHGDARGADRLAKEVCLELGIKQIPYPAEWDKLGKSAGVYRNARMLQEEKPDLVLAFPLASSRGTFHMIRIATEAGVKVEVVSAKTP